MFSRRCSIEDCHGRHYSLGFCRRHYRALKAHGDPLVSHKVASGHGKAAEWLKARVGFDGDECLIWPFSRMPNGYGSLRINTSHQTPHRMMCILAHGEPSSPKLMALHSCHKGHEGCVNPKHLRWGTPSQNQLDRVEAGTSLRGKRTHLTEADIRAIRSMRGNPHAEIGARFGTNAKNVNNILRGATWKWVT